MRIFYLLLLVFALAASGIHSSVAAEPDGSNELKSFLAQMNRQKDVENFVNLSSTNQQKSVDYYRRGRQDRKRSTLPSCQPS